jgi:hypothetical protein
MAKIEKLDSLVSKLRTRAAKANKDANPSVLVGYTAAYALFVHENLEAHHPVGQAKFLEQPARELGRELGTITGKAVQQGQTLAMGLVLAGLRLQRASQELVPVDTGNLRGSAFTRLEEGK